MAILAYGSGFAGSESMKFPVFSLINREETSSLETVSSSRESRANLTSSIRAPKLRSATACSLASLRRSVRHADFAGAKRSSNSLGRGFCARSPLKILSRPVHSSGDQITERREGKELHTAGRQRPRDPQTAPYRMAPHSPMMGLRHKKNFPSVK